MARKIMDLSQRVPSNARYVTLRYDIIPQEGGVRIFITAGDDLPVLLQGSGTREFELVESQTLYREIINPRVGTTTWGFSVLGSRS